jgi:heterodisulfide reductase subunit C
MTESVVEFVPQEDGLAGKLVARRVPVNACYQCTRCSAGCPMLSFMDLPPHRVIRMLQWGLDREVLESRSIWMCASCQTCTSRCPNEIEIAHLMDVLRQESRERGVTCPERAVEKFHNAFVKEIRRGRVHELSLIMRYKFATGRFVADARLGGAMFLRGRLRILPPRLRRDRAVRRLFDLAAKGD